MRGPPASRAAAPVTVRAVGSGGVEEVRGFLDDEEVAWALLRMEVGSGAFARTKFIAVHFNGEDVPVVRRGRLNSRKAEVLGHFGEVHATLEFKRREEFTVDAVCEQLLPVLTSDSNLEGDSGSGLSAKNLKQAYEALIAEQRKRASAKRGSVRSGPRTARECGPGRRVTAIGALAAVAASRGPYNWVLLEPTKLDLHNAGYGGLEELKAWLEDDKVFFGVIRFSFGTKGSSDCVKHVFVHWVGPTVPAVRRGQWNMQLGDAETAVRKACIVITLRKEVHNRDDLDIGFLITELRRLSVVDGAVDSVATVISVEEYEAMLHKECEECMEADQSDGEDGAAPQALPDVHAAVDGVRKSGESLWNWLLLGVGSATPKQQRLSVSQPRCSLFATSYPPEHGLHQLHEEQDAPAEPPLPPPSISPREQVPEAEAPAGPPPKQQEADQPQEVPAEDAPVAPEAPASLAPQPKAAPAQAPPPPSSRPSTPALDRPLGTGTGGPAPAPGGVVEAEPLPPPPKRTSVPVLASSAEPQRPATQRTSIPKGGEPQRASTPKVSAGPTLPLPPRKTSVPKGGLPGTVRSGSERSASERWVSETLSGRRPLVPATTALACEVKPGSLRLRTGWWWSRRHFELRAGHLRWWRRQEDCEREADPLGAIALVEGEIRWRVEHVGGTNLELLCHRCGSRTGPQVERYLLEAEDEREALEWCEAVRQHIRFVDMLLSFPLPLEGRQGDIRSYGISYPEDLS